MRKNVIDDSIYLVFNELLNLTINFFLKLAPIYIFFKLHCLRKG